MSYSKSQAQSGKGSIFSVGVVTITDDVPTTTWTVVGEVTSTAFSGNTAETAETTNFQSGNFKEFLPTIIDSGTTKITGNRVSSDAGQILVTAAFETLAIVPFQITLPKTPAQTTSGDTITWNALVQSSDFTIDTSKIIPFDITLKNSGAIVTVYGT